MYVSVCACSLDRFLRGFGFNLSNNLGSLRRTEWFQKWTTLVSPFLFPHWDDPWGFRRSSLGWYSAILNEVFEKIFVVYKTIIMWIKHDKTMLYTSFLGMVIITISKNADEWGLVYCFYPHQTALLLGYDHPLSFRTCFDHFWPILHSASQAI